MKSDTTVLSQLSHELILVRRRGAELLGVEPESLRVLTMDAMPDDYRLPKVKARFGPFEGAPIVWTSQDWTHGYQMFQTRHKVPVKYLIYYNSFDQTQRNLALFLLIPEKSVFKVWRDMWIRPWKRKYEIKAPILEQSVIKEMVKNTVDFLLNSEAIAKYGVRIRRGILLDGPPGNGKTMLCRYINAMARSKKISTQSFTSAEIETYYKNGKLNQLFNYPGITFFDDIDRAYLDRTAGDGKIACSVLGAMDGMAVNGDVVRVFTTNERIESLDKAFVRPGRIDKQISIGPPKDELRRLLLKSWPDELRKNIPIDKIVKHTDGFSFAELEEIRAVMVNNFVNGGKWDAARGVYEVLERRKAFANSGQVGLARGAVDGDDDQDDEEDDEDKDVTSVLKALTGGI